MNEINWTGPSDDQTAKIGKYMLRCEQMDRGAWWWCLYFNHETIDEGLKPGEQIAKAAVKEAYKEHLKQGK